MATPFPATHSIPSPGALAEEVLPHYAIDGLLQCRLHMSGVNDICRVRTETGHYMLKVYRASWRSAPAVLYELDLLAHLHRGGVTVSLPVARHDGGWITPIPALEGLRQSVLFDCAPGHPLSGPSTRMRRKAA